MQVLSRAYVRIIFHSYIRKNSTYKMYNIVSKSRFYANERSVYGEKSSLNSPDTSH